MEVDLIRIELPEKDKVVTLIPTAHVSKNSAEMAAEAIDEIKPDAICIELDEDRYNSLSDPEKYHRILKYMLRENTGKLLQRKIKLTEKDPCSADLIGAAGISDSSCMSGIRKMIKQETGKRIVYSAEIM